VRTYQSGELCGADATRKREATINNGSPDRSKGPRREARESEGIGSAFEIDAPAPKRHPSVFHNLTPLLGEPKIT